MAGDAATVGTIATTAINAPTQGERAGKLTASSQLIIETALRRAISVEIIAPRNGLFRLTFGSHSIMCSGSLTELTSVIAKVVCHDKTLTNQVLHEAGIHVPAQIIVSSPQSTERFLSDYKRIVIKPDNQSFGSGVSVDVRTMEEAEGIIDRLQVTGDEVVILEELIFGEDVRIVVIDFTFIAAIHRTPPTVTGDGVTSIRELIKKLNLLKPRNNHVPLNYETRRCLKLQEVTMDSILPEKKTVSLRFNTNEHTGGTSEDVTELISPKLRSIAEKTARVLNIPVVGIDFLVPAVAGDEYVIIEANSGPGLDGHEPQPVVEKFIDFLFPESKITA